MQFSQKVKSHLVLTGQEETSSPGKNAGSGGSSMIDSGLISTGAILPGSPSHHQHYHDRHLYDQYKTLPSRYSSGSKHSLCPLHQQEAIPPRL